MSILFPTPEVRAAEKLLLYRLYQRAYPEQSNENILSYIEADLGDILLGETELTRLGISLAVGSPLQQLYKERFDKDLSTAQLNKWREIATDEQIKAAIEYAAKRGGITSPGGYIYAMLKNPMPIKPKQSVEQDETPPDPEALRARELVEKGQIDLKPHWSLEDLE